jgi:uncharacterized protein (DUF2147 family)
MSKTVFPTLGPGVMGSELCRAPVATGYSVLVLRTPRKTWLWSFVLAMALLLTATARADAPSPVGYWVTIDDDGRTKKSIVQIYKQGDQVFGKIVRLINPPEPNPVCHRCSGKRKDKPVIGMVIIWDLERDGEKWSGGRILDPKNGKDYSCTIAVKDGGKKLEVRGYIGLSLFGRSQYWLRAQPPPTNN